MKIENSLTVISEIVEDYQERFQSMTINDLIEVQTLLATHSFYLAELTAQQMTDHNKFYWNRKVEISRKTLDIMRNKVAKNRAELEAMEDERIIELYREEMRREAEANRCKLILQQVNRILSALQQQISHKRKEEENARAT